MSDPHSTLLILAHTATWESRFQVSSLAASAAASGTQVDVGLFFAALEAWVMERWDVLDPSPPLDPESSELSRFPPLSSLLEAERTAGNIRLYACSTSTRLLALDAQRVQQKVEAIVGWPTFARLIQQAARVVTF